MVIDWVRRRADTVLPNRFLLGAAIELSAIAFSFDRSDASNYMWQAPFIKMEPKAFMVENGSRYIVHDAIRSIEDKYPQSFTGGVMLARSQLSST